MDYIWNMYVSSFMVVYQLTVLLRSRIKMTLIINTRYFTEEANTVPTTEATHLQACASSASSTSKGTSPTTSHRLEMEQDTPVMDLEGPPSTPAPLDTRASTPIRPALSSRRRTSKQKTELLKTIRTIKKKNHRLRMSNKVKGRALQTARSKAHTLEKTKGYV